MAGAVLGTLDFMPPEQRKDATQTDARSDLWSLAATLYQLVTGEPPRVIDLDEVPQELRSCLAQALKQKQDDRYQTAREFKDALRAAQQGVGTETLEEGQCPGCGTKNPFDRKFCRECAVSLEAECLSCSAVMPLWEKVCDSCGTKQADLLDERRSQMASDQSEAESLLKNCEYDGATEMATALLDEPDPRLQHLKGWAEKFLPQIDQERQQQLERISEQFKEAAAHEQVHDYTAALRVLEQVPEILREVQVSGQSRTVSGVMSRLQSTLDEIKRLDGEIRQRILTRQFNGLLSEVNQLLYLQPDRRGLGKVKTQLLDLMGTRDEAYQAAKERLSAQDYDGVLEEIARIDESLLSDAIGQLRNEAIRKRDRLTTLLEYIRNGVKTKKLHGLLKKVDEGLTLKFGDAELRKLRGQLQTREDKNAAQVANVIEKAQGLREECRFKTASNALGRIPVELMTQEASDLEEDCDYLAGQRETAMRSLKSAMDTESYDSGLAKTKEYCDSLDDSSLEDEEFSRALAACQRALKEQQEAEEAARQRRNAAAKRNVILGAIAAVVLLIASGLWIRSSMNANALAETARIAAQQAEAARTKAARIAAQRAEAARIAEQERILAKQRVEWAIESMSFKPISAGAFTMNTIRFEAKLPHRVTLTQDFDLGVYEVTQEQYEAVMGENPSGFKGSQNPVEQVSWDEAVAFCRKLSELPAEKKAGYVYRLPTEAEWEYACRFTEVKSELGVYAWYTENSLGRTHSVGGKKPNAWGLYDMHGNVSEWCQDWYGNYPSGSVTDPTGPASGQIRVSRGGGWNDNSDYCDSASRNGYAPDDRDLALGFRVVRSSIK